MAYRTLYTRIGRDAGGLVPYIWENDQRVVEKKSDLYRQCGDISTFHPLLLSSVDGPAHVMSGP